MHLVSQCYQLLLYYDYIDEKARFSCHRCGLHVVTSLGKERSPKTIPRNLVLIATEGISGSFDILAKLLRLPSGS
jgi:hypothetical protein